MKAPLVQRMAIAALNYPLLIHIIDIHEYEIELQKGNVFLGYKRLEHVIN